jgi:pSer/pThr/pTyr-binding forkhead associated (FHA) protein
MKLSLMVMNAGKTQGQTIPINLAQFIIGRDPQCNLRPASAVISKRHCALLVKNGQVSVRDFESTNGTFINEVPVKGEASLKNDDILKVGPLTFKVVIEAQATVTKPTPVPSKPAATADDDVAAMLLSLQDDGQAQVSQDDSSIPGGSTVMDIVPLNADKQPEAAKPAATAEKKEVKKDTAHLAAKALLDKYTRRPRA